MRTRGVDAAASRALETRSATPTCRADESSDSIGDMMTSQAARGRSRIGNLVVP